MGAVPPSLRRFRPFPTAGPKSKSAPLRIIDVRQLLYGRKPHVHRILFTIDGEMVNILHIRHGRRKSLSEH
jgi:hypothetical protein